MTKKYEELDQEKLKSLVSYDRETGVFRWTWIEGAPLHRNRQFAGKRCGTIDKDGYLQITLIGHKYLAHRLAFMYINGAWPDKEIDHIDGVRNNNAFSNIRMVSRHENKRNMKQYENNSTGTCGVGWHKQRNKWRAYASDVTGKLRHLGLFDCFDDAVAARNAASSEWGYTERHGKEKLA
jgi:hypothetical protein